MSREGTALIHLENVLAHVFTRTSGPGSHIVDGSTGQHAGSKWESEASQCLE